MGSNKRKIIILMISAFIILISTYSLNSTTLNNNLSLSPVTQKPNTIEDIPMDIASSEEFDHFKEFNVQENTGINQTDVIIDPVIFTEENKYCYKDSIRIFKSPFGSGDELVSQTYNLEPNAAETFSTTSDFGNPSGWAVTERPDTQIQLLPRFGGYKKVVEIFDNSTSGNYCDMAKGFTARSSGTYYITIMATINTTNAIAITGGAGYATCFGFYVNGNLYYSDGGATQDSGIPYELEKWYTFKCTFDCSSDQYSIWYWNESNQNWVVIGANIDFVMPQINVNSEWLHSSGIIKGTLYVAATDYSWSSGYEEDRILYLSSANIAFLDNLTASEKKTYRVYYNSTPTKPANYTNISRTNYTVYFPDGGSAVMYRRLVDTLQQFDENGNEHLSGTPDSYLTSTYNNVTGYRDSAPIISDGPVFIEAWQTGAVDDWIFYRFYANSYVYKYQNYPGSGRHALTILYASDVPNDFNSQFFRSGGSWINEIFDESGLSWVDHYNTLDKGISFVNDAGDPNILITIWDMTQDPWLDKLLIRECKFPPYPGDPALSINIGRAYPALENRINNSFSFWQFFKNASSVNITDKQNFVDNLYEVIIANPPTISALNIRDFKLKHFKEFYITENTGLNQSNVIIDPINFTEENKNCFKDSIRLYKQPYDPGDEIPSQIYNLEPEAWETFSNESDWGNPNINWVTFEQVSTNVQVLPRFNGHKKVVEIADNGGPNFARIRRYPTTNKINGTFYFTISAAQTNMYLVIGFGNAEVTATQFGFNDVGQIYYQDSIGLHDSGIAYSINKWYDFKCTFNCSSNSYYLWIWNETNPSWNLLANNLTFVNPRTDIDYIFVVTDSSGGTGTGHVAAFDCSWAPGYEEDRILYVSSANIAFIDNFTASETKVYRIYYNDIPTVPAMYTDISRTGYTVNFTDGASVIMYCDNFDVLRQFDKDGNEHLSGATQYSMTNSANNITGSTLAAPKISDGAIFIEAWQNDDANDWVYYKFYANSYVYKYQNYPGTGGFSFSGIYCDQHPIEFNASYFRQGGSWNHEDFNESSGSWIDSFYTLDQGTMFIEDEGDSDILIILWDITPDDWLKELRIRECRFPPFAGDPSLHISIGLNPSPLYTGITHSFDFWHFYMDSGSTNTTVKENFVDNLYDILIGNPPTISPLGPTNYSWDLEKPNINEVLQNPPLPGNLDSVNITVHITDNVKVDTVLINTNYTGSFQDYPMDFLSGTNQSGFWNFTIPQGPVGTTINYSIWVNDTSNNPNSTISFQYLIRDNELPFIIDISQDPPSPGNLDTVNITVHITDNIGVDTVLIYTNYTGSFIYHKMDLLSGSYQDGYWNYSIPRGLVGTTIIYSIWVNDTDSNLDSSIAYQYFIVDNEAPNIISIFQDPISPSNFDTVNITVHITENIGVHTVLINTNYTGSFENVPMDLLSGDYQDGYWNYTIPRGFARTTINYSIWVNDTSDNPNNTITYQYFIVDTKAPDILSILQTPISPGNLDTINITVHITDNIGVHTVLINTNHTAGFQNYPMELLSGDYQNGYWNYTIPRGLARTTINYSIWVNDTSDNPNNTITYQYFILDNEVPNIISISQVPISPGNLDTVNITVHITDNIEVHTVLINTNYTGSDQNYPMELLSGNYQDGYWNYTIPQGLARTTINYSIWVNDTSGIFNSSDEFQYQINDTESPSILNININTLNPQSSELINITIHITDNVEISQALLYTNLTGVYKFYPMSLIFGDKTDGYWSYSTLVPGNASGKTVLFQIWVNDTNGKVNNSIFYQFTVLEAKKEPFLLLPPPAEDNIIIIIIIIGSIAAVAIIASTIIAKNRAKKSEVRREERGKISYEDLRSKIIKPISFIPQKIFTQVQSLKNLSKQEKELLLKDLATLDENEIKEWLNKLKEIEE